MPKPYRFAAKGLLVSFRISGRDILGLGPVVIVLGFRDIGAEGS